VVIRHLATVAAGTYGPLHVERGREEGQAGLRQILSSGLALTLGDTVANIECRDTRKLDTEREYAPLLRRERREYEQLQSTMTSADIAGAYELHRHDMAKREAA
jgi:hypothetical protein